MESDITNCQKSVKEGFHIAIQQLTQRGSLSLPEEFVRPEPVPHQEDQNVSATGDRGDQNGAKESMNADQKNHNHQMESATRQ